MGVGRILSKTIKRVFLRASLSAASGCASVSISLARIECCSASVNALVSGLEPLLFAHLSALLGNNLTSGFPQQDV